MLKKSALNSDLAKCFGCLCPEKRRSPESCGDILAIGRALPLSVRSDVLADEWSLLQREDDVVPGTDVATGKAIRIDKYWNQFFELKNSVGEARYPCDRRCAGRAFVRTWERHR